jgi:MSHA biogenesis protein MshI
LKGGKLFGFLKGRGRQQPGWLAISLEPGRLHFAHAMTQSGRASLKRCGSRPIADDRDLERAAKELSFHEHQCLTVLPASDYQLLMIDAPNVPRGELRNAARWKIKDMLDYPVEQATLDLLDIPSEGDRGQSVYTVAARNETIRSCMERFSHAHIPLSVIDIVETAQRNLATFYEPPERGVAMLYAGKEHVLFTVNFRGELYMARRIEVGLDELEKLTMRGSDEAKNRILLELQRSFDHLERQFPFISLGKLLVAPTPADTGLQSYLAENLDLPVEEVRLAELLDAGPDVELDRDSAWRLFHVVGAALRS